MFEINKSLQDPPSKESSLTIKDKIATLDMMSWAAMGATLTTFWQIIIPFLLFPLNKPQLILGVTSIVFLLISLIVIYWSNSGYQFLKKITQPLQGTEGFNEAKNENPPLPTWHIEGTIYVTSFFLIAVYASCFFAIFENQGYSAALLAAKGIEQGTAVKESSIIINCQMIMIIVDIVILGYFVKYCYHLEFYPMHLPAQLGWFLTGFIFMCSITFGDTEYLPSQIGPINHLQLEDAKSTHSSIFWCCFIGILVTLFFLFEQRSIQQDTVPKVRFYFLPFLLLLLVGTLLISNSLNFLYASSSAIRMMQQDCKSTVSSFAQEYIDSIGCPQKYRTVELEGNAYFKQDCAAENIGIVWEPEIEKKFFEKENQLACMNLDCCYLVAEERTLQYKQFFFYAILTAFIGFIGAAHCFDIALQDPAKIRAGPSVYSQTKFVLQIILACFSIFMGVYMSFKYEVKVPNSVPIFNYKSQVNEHPQWPLIHNKLESIESCKLLRNAKEKPFSVHFDPTLCESSRDCNPKTQGFKVCVTGTNSAFQLIPNWQDKDATVIGINSYDPYQVLQAINGQKQKDQFCAMGLENAINKLLEHSVYVCSSKDKKAEITFQAKQQKVQLQTQQEPRQQLWDSENFHITRKTKLNHKQSTGMEDDESRAFTSLEFVVIDSDTYLPIPNASIEVFKDAKKCIELDKSVFYPIRVQKSDENGKAYIYHVPIVRESNYNIQIRADGYYYNCLITDKLQLFTINKFYIPLTKLLDSSHAMKVMLWYQDPKVNLELGANVVQTDNIECNVGYYNLQCNGMRYTNSLDDSEYKLSRVILLHQITQFNYIFFVRLLPQEDEILQVVNNKALSLTQKQQETLKSDIQRMVKAQAKLNVYSRNSLFPIDIYNMPVQLKSEIESTPDILYWLGLCMDGKVGTTSSKAINHFWEKRDTNQFWQRRTSSPQTIPDSKICEKMN